MIYVFKTTVNTEELVQQLKPHIDQLIPASRWNFDLEDCDKILRIDSAENIIHLVMKLFRIHNLECEELE